MSSTIFASKKRKQNVAKKDNDSEVEDDFADESDANKDGEESDSEEPEDEDDGSGTAGDFQGKAFDISRTVNLESGELADVLSEKDLPVPRKAIAKKTPAPVAAPKVLSEEDWEM
jgi:hypothetical protein